MRENLANLGLAWKRKVIMICFWKSPWTWDWTGALFENYVWWHLVGTAITPSPLVMVTTLPFAFLISSTLAWHWLLSALFSIFDDKPDHGKNSLNSANQTKHIDIHCSPKWWKLYVLCSKNTKVHKYMLKYKIIRIQKCTQKNHKKWLTRVFRSFYLYVSIETHSTSPKVAHLVNDSFYCSEWIYSLDKLLLSNIF